MWQSTLFRLYNNLAGHNLHGWTCNNNCISSKYTDTTKTIQRLQNLSCKAITFAFQVAYGSFTLLLAKSLSLPWLSSSRYHYQIQCSTKLYSGDDMDNEHLATAHCTSAEQSGEGVRLLRRKQIVWLRTTCERNATEWRKPLKSVLHGYRATILSA